jgi:hypothetical protein
MKTNSRKKSQTVGEFIARAYGVYFPHDLAHQGGTDANRGPMIPGSDFSPEANYGDDAPLQHRALGDAEMVS